MKQEERKRFAIIHDSHRGQTEKIALRIAKVLRSKDHGAIVYKLHCLPMVFSLEKYDAVILGSPIHLGKFSHHLEKFVETFKSALEKKPSYFFSVSLSAADPEHGREDAQQCVDKFLAECEWQPAATTNFAGALLYRYYNPILRWFMKRLVRKSGGETDTSKNHEYTNWERVEAFARLCAEPTPAQDGQAAP